MRHNVMRLKHADELPLVSSAEPVQNLVRLQVVCTTAAFDENPRATS